jgi:hypothetical protein
MRSRFTAIATILIGCTIVATDALAEQATTPTPPGQTIRDVRIVGKTIDRVARQVEEWGSMQMSMPLLDTPKTNFNFNLQRGTSNYFSEAKSQIQAASASLDQQFQSLSLAIQAQNSAGGTAASGSTNGNISANVFGGSGGTNRQPPFSASQFAGFLGLLSGLNEGSPTINNKAALNIAAGDQTTEAIFRLLGDPEKAAEFTGKQILFGAVIVSIDPGFRTRKDYAADLGILTRLDHENARPEVVKRLVQDTNLTQNVRSAILVSYELTREETIKALHCEDLKKQLGDYETCSSDGGRKRILSGWTREVPPWLRMTNFDSEAQFPVAIAVSPLADINVADEASSLRSQADFSLSLAAMLAKAGLQAQAAVLENYAHRHEQDARSRTPLVAINTYSAGGGLFGWQVGPSFRAMGDPGVKKGGIPANVLDRQTFPSLIMVAVDKGSLYPLFDLNDDGTITVKEPEISFTSIPRWLPLNHGWWKRLWQKRYSETERYETSARLVQAKTYLKTMKAGDYKPTAALADYRLRALKYQAFGSYACQTFDPQQEVPLPSAPQAFPAVAGIFPREVTLDADKQGVPKPTAVQFAVLGENLKYVDTKKITNLFGHVTSINVTPLGNLTNNVICFSGTVTSNGPIVFSLPWSLTNSAGHATAMSLNTATVDVIFHNDTNAPITILKTLQSEPSGTNNASEFTVQIAPKASPDDIKAALSIVINEINKSKRPETSANVSVQVNADQKK